MKASESLKFSRPLRAHQIEALDRFATLPEMGLYWEMGTGKTTEAIAWLRCKYNSTKAVLPTLVISPVATLYNWKKEFAINAPEKVLEQVEVCEGSSESKIKSLNKPDKKIFIINPEALDSPKVASKLRGQGFEAIILDEAHRFKGHKSKRFKVLLSISDYAKYRAMLTGTPILNGYLDLWAQWRYFDCGRTLGNDFFVYRERYFRDANLAWKGKPKYFPNYVPKPGIHEELSALIDKKVSRIKKTECLDLPPLTFKTVHVPMSADQEKSYRQMEKEMVAEIRSGTIVATNALSRVLRMLQILTGYALDENGIAHKVKENPRLAQLKELLKEITDNGHKVIVWSTFKENYRDLREACKELGLLYSEVSGEIGANDREINIDRFQNDPQYKVMLSNPQAGGEGINLTSAAYSIYYSRGYSAKDRWQSLARNHRGGSEIHDNITAIDLVTLGSIDEVVLEALTRKETFSDNVLDRLRKTFRVDGV